MADKLFIYTMLFTFIASAFSLAYGIYGYVYDFKYIEFVKNTPFENIQWMSNSRAVISYSAYTLYFAMNLRSLFWRKFLYTSIIVFIVSSIISFFLVDGFFNYSSSFCRFFGAFLISFGTGLYFLELIATDRILMFKKELVFYLALGTLLFYLTITPLLFMQKYISGNDYFREVFGTFLDALNFLMYGIFTAGFLIKTLQLRKEKRILLEN